MNLGLRALGIVFFSILFSASMGSSQESGTAKPLKVTSPAYENNKTIPSKYGCDGVNVNPAIRIENVPPGAKSLALLFDDKDAPRKTLNQIESIVPPEAINCIGIAPA